MGLITCRSLGHVGRLGNHLFQLAATIGMAETRGDQVVFPADWSYRPIFSVPDALFVKEIPPEAVEAPDVSIYQAPYDHPYLQHFSLFSHVLEQLRVFLQPSPEARKVVDGIFAMIYDGKLPLLAVHVRRGDNVFDPGTPNKDEWHLCPSLDYYQRGVATMVKTHGLEEYCTAVFTDDLAWCKDHHLGDVYGTGLSAPLDWIDLFLMARADYHVLSGSTYGIWAALLANRDPSCVVRVSNNYGPRLAHLDFNEAFDPRWSVVQA